MNKAQLKALRVDIEAVIQEREHLGEYNADSKYMMLLLKNMRLLIDHTLAKEGTPKK